MLRTSGINLLDALRSEVVEAALLLDGLREGVNQLSQRAPSLGVVEREDDEARGFGDGALYFYQQKMDGALHLPPPTVIYYDE